MFMILPFDGSICAYIVSALYLNTDLINALMFRLFAFFACIEDWVTVYFRSM
jgi:hypothetical protein